MIPSPKATSQHFLFHKHITILLLIAFKNPFLHELSECLGIPGSSIDCMFLVWYWSPKFPFWMIDVEVLFLRFVPDESLCPAFVCADIFLSPIPKLHFVYRSKKRSASKFLYLPTEVYTVHVWNVFIGSLLFTLGNAFALDISYNSDSNRKPNIDWLICVTVLSSMWHTL